MTNANVMPAFTQQYLASRTGATIFALGGPAAAAGGAPAANQIVGADRYATAVMTAQRFFPNPTAIGIASGEAFPDGLTGGAHIGKIGGPLLLTAQLAAGQCPDVLAERQGDPHAAVHLRRQTAAATQVVTQINTAVA